MNNPVNTFIHNVLSHMAARTIAHKWFVRSPIDVTRYRPRIIVRSCMIIRSISHGFIAEPLASCAFARSENVFTGENHSCIKKN